MGNKQSQVPQDFLYSVPVTEKVKGETAVYRHPQYKDKLHEFYSDITKQTLRDCFLPIFKAYSNVNFLGTKSVDKVYHYKTYGQCFEIIQQLGSGIYNMNLTPQKQEYQDYKIRPIGIMSRNREEWILVDLVAALYGFVSAALFSTMPDIHQSIKLVGMETVFGSKEGLDDLMKIEGSLPLIRAYVCFDPFTENDVNLAKRKGIEIISYEKVLEEGKKTFD